GLVDGSAVGADRRLRRARDGTRRRRRDASGGGGAAPGLPLAVGRVAALRGGAPLRRRERAHLPRTSPLLSVLRPRSPAVSPRARRASRLVQAPSPRRRLTRARSGPSPRWPSARSAAAGATASGSRTTGGEAGGRSSRDRAVHGRRA